MNTRFPSPLLSLLFVPAVLLALSLACPPPLHAGAVFISGDDADDTAHCQGKACGGLYPRVLKVLYSECQPVPTEGEGILAIGVHGEVAESTLLGWNDPQNGGPGAPLAFARSPEEIALAVLAEHRVVYIPSDSLSTPGGITPEEIAALNQRQADIQAYINDHNGRLLALTEVDAPGAFGWLPNPLTFEDIFDFDMAPTLAMAEQFPGTGATDRNLDHCCYHNDWTGPAGYSGLEVLAVSRDTQILDPADPEQYILAPVILGGCNVRLSREVCGNGSDDDGDGQVDEDDRDCQRCGDGDLDPGEQCDDGNLQGGDGCDASCRREGSNLPPACAAGGPYVAECQGGRGEVLLDAAASFDPEGMGLDYTWGSDCPDARLGDAAAMVSTLSVRAPAPCAGNCAATLVVADPGREQAACAASVRVEDTLPPLVANCALAPLAPRDPRSPRSAPRSEQLRIDCGQAEDACDPAPQVAVRLTLSRAERDARGTCVVRDYDIPVACGETVTLLSRSTCPPRRPGPPPPPFRIDADGRKLLEGELRLEVEAVDACGHRSPVCVGRATDGTLLRGAVPAAPGRARRE